MPNNGNGAAIFVVSGGAGASGELLLETLLAQFPREHAQVTVFPYVHTPAQVEDVVSSAAEARAFVVHTMVDGELRRHLRETACEREVTNVDLVGELLAQLSQHLALQPLGQPGRYREYRNDYFRRIEAIEYTVKHDDGQHVDEFDEADIVLLGVSRVGKTPLSVYLSLEGWKTANYPVVEQTPLPVEILEIPPARVVGLTLTPAQLVRFRLSRQQKLGLLGGDYVDLQRVIEEVRAANHMFAQHGFLTVDVTDKPLEAISEEVVAAVGGDHR
jgi:regulator of PEP synthase PpsR (kinase-PPPase family)